jgi:hypothetical protein
MLGKTNNETFAVINLMTSYKNLDIELLDLKRAMSNLIVRMMQSAVAQVSFFLSCWRQSKLPVGRISLSKTKKVTVH